MHGQSRLRIPAQRLSRTYADTFTLGRRFGYDPGKIVLRDIDLEVQPGEMIGLVGRSGVAK